MNKFLIFLGIAVLIMAGTKLEAQIALENGIVRIDYVDNNNIKGNGTGIVIFRDNNDKLYILTALHVVADSLFSYQDIQVKFLYDAKIFAASIFAKYKNYDLAILELSTYPKNVPLLYLGTSSDKNLGDQISMYGYPQKEFEYKGGNIRKFSGDKIILDHLIPQTGNSGGPIIYNETDEVIGIVLQKAENSDADQFAFNIDILKNLLTHTDNLKNAILKNENNLAKGGSNYSQIFPLNLQSEQ